jgi:hypothetical protein
MAAAAPTLLWKPRVIAISVLILGLVSNFAVGLTVGLLLAAVNWRRTGQTQKALIHLAAGLWLVLLYAASDKPGLSSALLTELLIIPFLIYYGSGVLIALYLYWQIKRDQDRFALSQAAIQEPPWRGVILLTVLTVFFVGLLQVGLAYGARAAGWPGLPSLAEVITEIAAESEFRGIAVGLVQKQDFGGDWRWDYSSVARNEGLSQSIWAEEEGDRVADRAAHSLQGVYGELEYSITFFHLIKRWREPVSADLVHQEFVKHVNIYGPPMPIRLISTGQFQESTCVADSSDFRGCEMVIGHGHYTSHLKVHVTGQPPIDPASLEAIVNEALAGSDARLAAMEAAAYTTTNHSP